MGGDGDAFETSAEWTEDIVDKAREKVGEKVKAGEEKVKGERWALKKTILRWCVLYVS